MTEKRAETATPHLQEAPEQQQQVEHEEAIEDAGKYGKRGGAGFEKRIWPPHTGTCTRPLALPQLTVAALSYTHETSPRPHPR
jgi:hypothetical protein